MSTRRPEFMYFDLGNVLLFFDHALALRAMAKVAGVDPERMRQVVWDDDLQNRYETGLISGQEFVDTIARALDRKLDTGEMLQAAADMFVPNHGILPVLDEVNRLGIPIGLLSNTCEAHWKWILELRYPQVVGRFDPVILSFEAKSMKPDPLIYEVATRAAKRDPGDIFFTDDRHENVDAARVAGWQAAPFTSADRLFDIIRAW